MRAELKEIIVSDIDPNLYWPEEEGVFGFYIQAIIGPEGHEGGDTFGFQVCSPKWIMKKYESSEIIFGMHMIIMIDYDFFKIEKKISSLCDSCFGADWQEIAKKLSFFGDWEFDNYDPIV